MIEPHFSKVLGFNMKGNDQDYGVKSSVEDYSVEKSFFNLRL